MTKEQREFEAAILKGTALDPAKKAKKRKRPGKSQRANTVTKAVRIVRAAKMTENQKALDAEKQKPKDLAARLVASQGPRADRGGSSRERLKLGSGGVGFRAPKGFFTPKDHLSREERTPGLIMAPRDALRITAEASKRFALDDYPTGDAKGPGIAKVKRGKRKWQTLGRV